MNIFYFIGIDGMQQRFALLSRAFHAAFQQSLENDNMPVVVYTSNLDMPIATIMAI